jgi:6-phosphogluconate dehydrogenase
MQLGVIGMGRMGANIARRLIKAGHECVVWDQAPAAVALVEKDGAGGAADMKALVAALDAPRAVWVMLPSGPITDGAVTALGDLLEAGDTVIDGGNTFYRDDIRRAEALKAKHISYLDVGTSGGVWGLERGYCMMIGGEKAAVDRLDPIFAALAPGIGEIPATARPHGADPRPEHGYIHAGPVGSGHFVKMIHNGIEYGLMQAYAEGFDILRAKGAPGGAPAEQFDLNLADIAEVWRRGSVISSWLLDLTADALAADAALTDYSGVVEDSGEGRWTVDAAVEEAVPAHVLTAALFARFRSRETHSFGEKLLSAMRHGFGGHVEPKG